MRKSTPRKQRRINPIGGIDVIARSKPIDAPHLLDMRLMAYLHFDAILHGIAEVPTRENDWIQATQWMSLVMTGAAIAQHMTNAAHDQHRPRSKISEALERRSKEAYLSFAEALIKSQERGSNRLVMTSMQIDASRKFLWLYTQVLGIINVGQISDAANAAGHGIKIFREELLK